MATLARHLEAPAAPVQGAYKVDISRGRNIGRVSSEWYSRPDDEKFLSLDELYGSVRRRADRARTRVVESRDVRVEASMDNAERLSLIVPGEAEPILPPICGTSPQPLPASISSMGCSVTAASR